MGRRLVFVSAHDGDTKTPLTLRSDPERFVVRIADQRSEAVTPVDPSPDKVTNVLIVDDDAAIRNMLKICLQLEGFHVETASNGLSALEALESKRPDVILLDIMMPFLNGYQLIEKLRADPTGPVIPILVLSAKNRDEDIWEGWSRGIESYITKPLDIQLLLDEVVRVTSRK